MLVALLCVQACLAQADPWDRVGLIEPSSRVAVKLHSGKTVNGRMEAWSVKVLTVIEEDGLSAQLARSDIARVSLVTGMSRGRKAKHAFLITSAIWGGTAAIVYFKTISGHDDAGGVGIAAALTVPVVGAIAAAIASLFPPHKEVIYKASAVSKPGN
jgi:hypothetical protein